MLVGREGETAQLVDLVERARHGTAGSLVVWGEPGVGKTALLDELLGNDPDALVLRTQGLEAEAPLAFAALHRLLLPVMRLRDELPLPQARALRISFGEEDGPAVEPFLVALGTHSMLTTTGEERLVLCVVDDAHWLDRQTADALLFAARRLGADRVVMVFSARPDVSASFRPSGIEELTLTGLDASAARALLEERAGLTPSVEVSERLIAETGGNPLALLELPTTLSQAELEGTTPLPARLPLTARVEQSFLDRCLLLPAAVQTLLLLVSADDAASLAVIQGAAAALGVDDQQWDEAVQSGLVVVHGDTIRVRHPLVRSAIYQGAPTAARKQAHGALADSYARICDSDRATWHRAAATEGPDDALAAALEASAMRSELRGGYGPASLTYQRASALATDEGRRAELSFAAARNAWASGQPGQSRTLLAAADTPATDPALRSDIARLRGRIEANVGTAETAHRIFVEAAEAVRAVDSMRALEMGVLAALLRAFGADSGAVLTSTEALAATASRDDPRARCLAELLPAMTYAAEKDPSKAIACLRVAFEVGVDVDDLDVLGNLGNAALHVGDDEAAHRFYELMLSRARARGTAMAVIYALQRLCFGHFVRGDLASVRRAADEALALGHSLNQPAVTASPLAWLTLLAAVQARDDYGTLLEQLEDVATSQPLGILADPVHDVTRWAKGVRAASKGDTFGALHHLAAFRLPLIARMATLDRIDVAVRAGEIDQARSWVEDLSSYSDATGWPWARAATAYGNAMTGETGQDENFQVALSSYAASGRSFDQARAELAYGEWLRRSQRRVDARAHLRIALETFLDVRAETLAERANQELRASGETARKRDPSTLVKLTPMELKIAQLVSSGLSNKDVAAQCWVSPRTVAFHLRNVFAKAGITSRGELAQLDLG